MTNFELLPNVRRFGSFLSPDRAPVAQSADSPRAERHRRFLNFPPVSFATGFLFSPSRRAPAFRDCAAALREARKRVFELRAGGSSFFPVT
jgi:hypothetical protein